MGIRSFALTYPQLINQALTEGVGEEGLRRLRTAYELAEWEFNGFYRGQGMPFLCHLVRTASIVLAEKKPLHVVMAALLHALYMKGAFFGGPKGKAGPRERSKVQKAVGEDVEEMVWDYHRFPWSTREAIDQHLLSFESYGEKMRQLLMIRLANQLEDYLDLGMIYRGASPQRMKTELAYEKQCIRLAHLLGMRQLAAELEEVFEPHRKTPSIPENALRRRGGAYKLPRYRIGVEGRMGQLRNTLKKIMKGTDGSDNG